jgi:hypothetical protein
VTLSWSIYTSKCSRLTIVATFGSIAPEFVFALMRKKETLNFRVSAEFKRRLIEEADKERRSLTNYLETTFTKLWDEGEATTAKRRQAQKGPSR